MFGLRSYLLVLALVFVVSGDISTNEKVNSVTQATSELQSNLEGMDLPPAVTGLLGLPNINEGEDMLREKCIKNGGNESFEIAMEARRKFEECIQGLVDVSVMKQEIAAAKPTGDLDSVFKKYCRKTPTLKGCIQDFLNGTEKCLGEQEQSQMSIVTNITDSLMNFVCYKEGDRIALFIAEGGPECLTNKAAAVQNCVNSTISNAQLAAQGQNISTEDIPEFVFDPEKCDYFTEVQKCVVQVLEDCKEPTPANIVGSLFDFVRKSTPCIKFQKTSAGNLLVFSVMSILLPLGAIILAKI